MLQFVCLPYGMCCNSSSVSGVWQLAWPRWVGSLLLCHTAVIKMELNPSIWPSCSQASHCTATSLFTLSTGGSCECVSGLACLKDEQSESAVEDTTGLIIGNVPRTHANKFFPSPPRSYKHVNENPLFIFLPLLPCPSPPFHHSSLHPRCNQRVWENTTYCLADPARDAGWIWRQGCSAWWLTCLAGDNLFFLKDMKTTTDC